jgi:hypothetical protein
LAVFLGNDLATAAARVVDLVVGGDARRLKPMRRVPRA